MPTLTSTSPHFSPAHVAIRRKAVTCMTFATTPDNDCKLWQSLSGGRAGMVDTMLSALTELKSCRVRHCAVAVRLHGHCMDTAGGAPSGGAPSGGAPSGGAPSGGAPSGGAPSGGVPSRCGVPIRRSGAMRRSDPTHRGRAMQRDAAPRSDVSARCGVPVRRFGHTPRRLVRNAS